MATWAHGGQGMSFSDRLQKFYERTQVIGVREDSEYPNTSKRKEISEWD